MWVRSRSTCIVASNILSQICGNSGGICMFLGHIYGSGAVCEYSIWVTHTVELLPDSDDVALQCESL